MFMLWKLQSLWSVNTLTYQPSWWSVMFWVLIKVSPEWRKDLGFKKCPSPLNRGVSSTELTDKKIMWIFAWGQISRPLNGSHSLLNRLRCFNEEVLLYNILFLSPVKNQYLQNRPQSLKSRLIYLPISS